jgi:hypothetical protein
MRLYYQDKLNRSQLAKALFENGDGRMISAFQSTDLNEI